MNVLIPVKYGDTSAVEYVKLSLGDRGMVVIDMPKGRESVKLPPAKLHAAVERLFGR